MVSVGSWFRLVCGFVVEEGKVQREDFKQRGRIHIIIITIIILIVSISYIVLTNYIRSIINFEYVTI